MNKIENIIFDFGGVLYDISFERAAKAFEYLGFNHSDFKHEFHYVFIEFENGTLNPDEFVNQLKSFAKNQVTNKEILHAFDQILIGIDQNKVADVRKLKQNYRLFLLSNTNEIHFRKYSAEIKANIETNDFYTLFEKEYYSHELKLRKPDRDIYNYVINDSDLDPNGTLFVDDSKENIMAASSLGIQTFWIENIQSWDTLIKMLNNNLLI